MGLQLYNTFTRSLEPFVPLDPAGRKVTFYNCGPTVYGPFHVGNARNYIVADVLRRWLEHIGYQVRFVQNITDVDDKIIARATEEKRSTDAVAEDYTRMFFDHAGRLGVRRADVHPKATEFIPDMIAMIGRLIEKKHAYTSPDGSVWFNVESFSRYGELSKKPLEELREGERVVAAQQQLKRHPGDFALWKASKPGEPSWPSPWGPGRPGWHIECSCMATALLGETIDIHMGGVDLVFPHHENERAQSECATEKAFVRYWIHNGFLNVRDDRTGEEAKMSKSLGNFFRIDEVLERYDALTVRHFLISAQYRSPLTFSEGNLKASKAAVRRIVDALRRAERLLGNAGGDEPIEKYLPELSTRDRFEALRAEFSNAMNDDLNTPVALGAVFGAVQELNRAMDEVERPTVDASDSSSAITVRVWQRLLRDEFLKVLGLDPVLAADDQPADALVPALLELLIAVRAEARKRKLYDLADLVRTQLQANGITLEDTPSGTVWKRSS